MSKSIEIVGHGVTISHYKKCSEETWGICLVGAMLPCDFIWYMDDIEHVMYKVHTDYREIFKNFERNFTPVITSRQIPHLANTIQFPLQKVIAWAERNGAVNPYWFVNTVCYAVAYAGFLGDIDTVYMQGVDYVNYIKYNEAENGQARECTTHWLSFLAGLGIKIKIIPTSFLCARNKFLAAEGIQYYGYHEQPNIIQSKGLGQWNVQS